MNPENRILKTGKGELQSMQWFTLYSISMKRFSKPVGLKDVTLSVPRQCMSL